MVYITYRDFYLFILDVNDSGANILGDFTAGLLKSSVTSLVHDLLTLCILEIYKFLDN